MKYPSLVPPSACKTDVRVTLTGGLSMSGDEETLCVLETKCNLQFGVKQRFTSEKRVITVVGTALFCGDLYPDAEQLHGMLVTKEGVVLETECGERLQTENGAFFHAFSDYGQNAFQIYRAQKERNPDGTVNYTRLELM